MHCVCAKFYYITPPKPDNVVKSILDGDFIYTVGHQVEIKYFRPSFRTSQILGRNLFDLSNWDQEWTRCTWSTVIPDAFGQENKQKPHYF